MKGMMLGLALTLVLGCGKKEETKPQGQTKAPAKAAVQKPGTVLWEFETGGGVASPALGADGTVYVGSSDKKVYALDGKTGAKKWEFETGDGVASPALGADGTVYVGSLHNKVYALDGKTGAKKWEFKTGYYVFSSPALGTDGILYVGSSDTKVCAIQTSSPGLVKSPWPMRGQNPQHTGRVPKKK